MNGRPARGPAQQHGGGQPLIVVGVSGSPASAAALRWARNEADRRRGRVKAVLTVSPEHRAYYARPNAGHEPGEDIQRARRSLAATMDAVLGPGPWANTTAEVVLGTAERTLVAESAGADLLVLGSAAGAAGGRHRTEERSIGPVIRTCLGRAHCPVVVVSQEAAATDLDAGPTEASTAQASAAQASAAQASAAQASARTAVAVGG